MFFLFDSLLANKGAWMWHKKQKFYPDVEFYVWKDSSEKHVSKG